MEERRERAWGAVGRYGPLWSNPTVEEVRDDEEGAEETEPVVEVGEEERESRWEGVRRVWRRLFQRR